MVCPWQKQEGKCPQLQECLDAEERVQFRGAPADVPRREEEIPHEPREEEPARPVRAAVNEPYPREHQPKESKSYTKRSYVRRGAMVHSRCEPGDKVKDQENCG